MDDDDTNIGEPMDYDEQTDAFRFALDDLVGRYSAEFDINCFVIIGALQEKIVELVELGSFESDIDIDDDDF